MDIAKVSYQTPDKLLKLKAVDCVKLLTIILYLPTF